MAANYNNLLTVDPVTTHGTRVTKVTKKDYGYRIQMFNNYIMLFYVKLIINEDKSAKAHYLVKRNYSPDKRYTLYFDCTGNQTTPKEYKNLKH